MTADDVVHGAAVRSSVAQQHHFGRLRRGRGRRTHAKPLKSRGPTLSGKAGGREGEREGGREEKETRFEHEQVASVAAVTRLLVRISE